MQRLGRFLLVIALSVSVNAEAPAESVDERQGPDVVTAESPGGEVVNQDGPVSGRANPSPSPIVGLASGSESSDPLAASLSSALPDRLRWIDTGRLAYSAQLGVTMVLLGLVPAFFLMTTSYIRIAIVLSVLRQAFGAQLLPVQATTALTLLCTGLVMWPTWQSVHERAVVPWLKGDDSADLVNLCHEGVQPIREFMIRQIDARGNADDVHLFLRQVTEGDEYPSSYEQVPLRALLPAFVISELKAAFLIGFQIYLPFLVIDLVVATATTSMGMFMLPPGMVSLPLKLLLFVMVDGWRLIVEMLLTSFP